MQILLARDRKPLPSPTLAHFYKAAKISPAETPLSTKICLEEQMGRMAVTQPKTIAY